MAELRPLPIGHHHDGLPLATIEPQERHEATQASRVIVNFPALKVLLIPAKGIAAPGGLRKASRRIVLVLGQHHLRLKKRSHSAFGQHPLPSLIQPPGQKALSPAGHVIHRGPHGTGSVGLLGKEGMVNFPKHPPYLIVGPGPGQGIGDRSPLREGAVHAQGTPKARLEQYGPGLAAHPFEHPRHQLIARILVNEGAPGRCRR